MAKVQVVRVLWGDIESNYSMKDEIPLTPLFDEIVYVYGEKNKQYLDSLGYKSVLVSPNYNEWHGRQQAIHKLEALTYAEKDFGKFLLLDFDLAEIKPIDDKFWDYLDKFEFACPIYGFPSQWLEVDKTHNTQFDTETRRMHSEQTKKYGWKYLDNYVIPNAGFVYSTIPNFGEDTKRICLENDLVVNLDELAFAKYFDMDLETYIKNHEPPQLHGRSSEVAFEVDFKTHKNHYPTFKEINDLAKSIVEKDLYLWHY